MIIITEIREEFLNYLVENHKFSKAECKIVWSGIDEYFTEVPELVKEVMTRDILEKQTTLKELKSEYNEYGCVK